jgi:Predicted integral membrane protein (DUF2269)
VLVNAVAFSNLVLAVHITAVVVAFGVTFAYPLIALGGERLDRRMLPWFHRLQVDISRKLINPGLLVVLIAGIYLASDLHQWKHFYVQWGVAVAVILGGLEGAFMVPRQGKLADLAERDVATGAAQWSPEYLGLRKRVAGVGTVQSLLVVVTIFLMATGAPA